MLNGPLMKIFEKYPIVPSIFELRNLISFCLLHFLGRNTIRGFHNLQMIGLHEQCESVSRYLLASYFGISDNAMRRRLEISSSVDLGRLAELECQHMRRNCNSCHISKSILRIQPPTVGFKVYLFAIFIDIHCRC